MTDHEEQIWNFAYGANLNPNMLWQRGIKPVKSIRGILQNYKLVFDHKGFPFGEAAYANITPHEGEEVHGVLHRINQLEWKMLLGSESRAYTNILLPIKVYQEDISLLSEIETSSQPDMFIQAWTFINAPGQAIDPEYLSHPKYQPPKRYVNKIIAGAKHFKLKEEYIENRLIKQSHFRHSFLSLLILGTLMIFLFPTLVIPFFICVRLKRDASIFHYVLGKLQKILWCLHNFLYKEKNKSI